MTTTHPRRRFFRYSLRTLFVHGLLAGVGLGWLGSADARGEDASQSISNQERPSSERKLLSRVVQEPQYVRNEGYDSKWYKMIKRGIDESRAYFGNVGPVYVYVIGHQTNELDDDKVRQEIIDAFCERRHSQTMGQIDDCKHGAGADLVNDARNNRTDASLSFVDYTDPPMAELMFVNPHNFGSPYLYTRGIHEYTHVFQRSFPRTPTWMMEGGAEFFAYSLGEQQGWTDFKKDMKQSMEKVHRIQDRKLGIQDMEDIESVSSEIKKYHRHLAYDAGAWAFAFMVHKSSSRSVKEVCTMFYPLVAEEGWEAALTKYVDMDSKEEFYREFSTFLEKPLEEQVRMLDTLKK